MALVALQEEEEGLDLAHLLCRSASASDALHHFMMQ